MGTYSCHGVEPSFDDDEEGAVMAKINQDRGCVVYPFNEDNQQALFCVFDGEQMNPNGRMNEGRASYEFNALI